jgi:hypothetical protein
MHAFDEGQPNLGPEPGTKRGPCRVREPGLDFVEVLETQPPLTNVRAAKVENLNRNF